MLSREGGGSSFHATVAQVLSLMVLGSWEGHFPVLSFNFPIVKVEG